MSRRDSQAGEKNINHSLSTNLSTIKASSKPIQDLQSNNPQQPPIHIKVESITMSNNGTYSTFSSTSYSSSTDAAGNTRTEAFISNPSGTTVHRTSQEAGKPAVSESSQIRAGGGGAAAAVQGGVDRGRMVEDVTDADRQYEERMEDEYAKREGGA
ncbi:MAG: hypothetical protein Q9182_000609 [Xanthomendoza sp. 2 TL-2023]